MYSKPLLAHATSSGYSSQGITYIVYAWSEANISIDLLYDADTLKDRREEKEGHIHDENVLMYSRS